MTDFKKRACHGCMKNITAKDYFKCLYCENYYDLECANATQRSFASLKQSLKDSWKCPECKTKERKGDNSNTPVRSATAPPVPAGGSNDDGNVTKRKPAGTGAPVNEEEWCLNKDNLRSLIKSEIAKAVAESVAVAVQKQLQSVNDVLGGLQISFTAIDTQLESLKSTLAEKNNVIAGLQAENGHLRDAVHRLEDHIRQAEQQALVNDVDIVGVPEAKGESVVHVVTTLALKLGVTLSENDIVSADRVGAVHDVATGRPRARPIAVRLVRRAVRENLLRAARVRRGVTTADGGLNGEARRFYINERLTRENRQLFLRAREIGSSLKWRFVWTKDGRVFARQHQSDDSPRHRLRSEADLIRVFGAAAVGACSQKFAS